MRTRGQIAVFLLVQTLRDVARGLAHLHDNFIVHRDISARNILLAPAGAKIADFGLARKMNQTETINSTAVAVGPLRWMAPEAYPGFFSAATDIYMFGMLMYASPFDPGCLLYLCLTLTAFHRFEVFSGQPPFSDIPLQAVPGFVTAGNRPIMPSACPPDLARLAVACWAQDPAQRPSARAVADALDAWLRAPSGAATAATATATAPGDVVAPVDSIPAPAAGTAAPQMSLKSSGGVLVPENPFLSTPAGSSDTPLESAKPTRKRPKKHKSVPRSKAEKPK